MLGILKTIIGFLVCFYLFKGMLGKFKDGDLTKFLLAIAAYIGIAVMKSKFGA
jgi:hypothetical protein